MSVCRNSADDSMFDINGDIANAYFPPLQTQYNNMVVHLSYIVVYVVTHFVVFSTVVDTGVVSRVLGYHPKLQVSMHIWLDS